MLELFFQILFIIWKCKFLVFKRRFAPNLLTLMLQKVLESAPRSSASLGAVPFGQSRMIDPTVSRCHILSFLSLGRTTFSSRDRSMTSPKKYFPSSSTSSHYVSAVKSMHYGGARTSNLPLNSLANLYLYTRQTRFLTPYVALNESAPTAR